MKKSTTLMAMIAALILSLALCACNGMQPTQLDAPVQSQESEETQVLPESEETDDATAPVVQDPEVQEPSERDEEAGKTYTLTIRHVDAETGEEIVPSKTYPVPTRKPNALPKPPQSGDDADGDKTVGEANQLASDNSEQETVETEYVPYTYPKAANGDPDWENMTDSEIIRCLDYLSMEPATQFDMMNEIYFDLQGKPHGYLNGTSLYYATRGGKVYEAKNEQSLPWNLSENAGEGSHRDRDPEPGDGSTTTSGDRYVGQTNRVIWVTSTR